jgi:hypothetical protein
MSAQISAASVIVFDGVPCLTTGWRLADCYTTMPICDRLLL